MNSPVEGKYNQHVSSHAQNPDDKHKEGDDVVDVVRHIHLAYEAARAVCVLRFHALSRPHDSDTLSGLPICKDDPGCSPVGPGVQSPLLQHLHRTGKVKGGVFLLWRVPQWSLAVITIHLCSGIHSFPMGNEPNMKDQVMFTFQEP